MALLNEQISGKYEILGALREGGMGSLYKVRHRLLDEIRVVKVIRSPADTGGEGADRFLREARAANRLRHPNVAVLHDFAIADDGQAFIVMEYIDGWNLLEVLSGYGPPPVSLTVEIARQSLKALGYLHRHKIVHRDVSPDNLMLSRDVDGHPLVKLIDLGIAKGLEGNGELTTTGVFLGKPRYGSPERFSGEEWDERSDLYSFGVVLYELLTGRVPIAGSDPASLMAGHLFRPPLDFAETDPQGRVPPELRALVLQALAKKPQERIASAEAFVWELTMLQDRFPLIREDLDGAWNVLLPLGTGRAPVALRPGSTQDRLDAEFAMARTPTAGTFTGEATLRTATAPEARPARPPEPSPNLAEVLPFQAPGHIPGNNPGPIADAGLPLTSEPTRRVTPIQDLDATWISRSPRLDTGPLRPAPVSGQDASETPRKSRALWIAAAAGVAAALFAAGFLVSRHVDVPPAAVPATEVSAAPAQASPAAAFQATSDPVTHKSSPSSKPSTEESHAAAKAPASAPVPLEPIKPGDLILAGQPGVQPAEIKDLPAYPYPAAAKGSGRKVSIHVAVLVDETGAVVQSRIREGDTAGLGFNEAALEAAKKARYFPATRDQVAGKMWTDLVLEFAE